jgi:hypothetical protein
MTPTPSQVERARIPGEILEIVCQGHHKQGGPACQKTCGVQVNGIWRLFLAEFAAIEREAAERARENVASKLECKESASTMHKAHCWHCKAADDVRAIPTEELLRK